MTDKSDTCFLEKPKQGHLSIEWFYLHHPWLLGCGVIIGAPTGLLLSVVIFPNVIYPSPRGKSGSIYSPLSQHSHANSLAELVSLNTRSIKLHNRLPKTQVQHGLSDTYVLICAKAKYHSLKHVVRWSRMISSDAKAEGWNIHRTIAASWKRRLPITAVVQ